MKLRFQANFIYKDNHLNGNRLIFLYLSKNNESSVLHATRSFYRMDIVNDGLSYPLKEFNLKKIG